MESSGRLAVEAAESGRLELTPLVRSGIRKADAKLSRRQSRALVALLRESTIRNAAKSAGVSECSIRRWLRTDRDFMHALREVRAAILEGTLAALTEASAEAVTVLREAMRTGTPATKARAAATVLDQSTRIRESVELARQIEEIERKLEGTAS